MITIHTYADRKTQCKITNLFFGGSNIDADLFIPNWCNEIKGTNSGIWIEDDGTATYTQKLKLWALIKDLNIESNLKQHAEVKIWTPGEDCVF